MKTKGRLIAKVLLCAYVVIAITLTIASQINYKNNLVHIGDFCDCTSGRMWHNVEYPATLQKDGQKYVFKWNMTGSYANYILSAMNSGEVQVVHIQGMKVAYKHNSNEELASYIVKGEETLETIINNTEEKGSYIELVAKADEIPESFKGYSEFIVSLSFLGGKNEGLVPKSSVLSTASGNFIFLLKERQKIWGTEYYLQAQYIEIQESSETTVGISMKYGDKVVEFASPEYYDGMLVAVDEVAGELSE